MRIRSFLILALVTVLVTAAAIVASIGSSRPHSSIAAAGPMLPGLSERLGDVAAVVVREGGKTLTIHRTASGWGLAEYADYPAQVDKVRETARALVQLEKAEAKTTRADRWSRLAVGDVDATGSTAKELILRNSAGETVADLIVGKSGAGVGGERNLYVRVPGEAQAWLVRGTVDADAKPGTWVERGLINVPAVDVQQIRIVHPDKSTLTLVREGEGGGFRVAELPAGGKGKLKRPDAVNELVEAVADLQLEELAPLAGQPFPADKTLRVTITRTDGTVIAFDTTEQNGEQWLRFVDGKVPAGLPAAASAMAFRVPIWKISPLDKKVGDLLEAPSG